MNGLLLVAAIGWWVIGLAHSIAGEKLLIGPLLAHEAWPNLRIGRSTGKSVVRFAWHLTTVAWWGFGLILAWASVDGARVPYVEVIMGMAIITGLVALIASRGGHPAWVVFLGIGLVVGASAYQQTMASPAVRGALAWGLAAVLFSIALLHVYWVVGGRWGLEAALPEGWKRNAPVPGFRALTLLVAIGLTASAALVLASGSILPLPVPDPWVHGSVLALSIIFALRVVGDFRHVGVFKRNHKGAFARLDTRLYAPLCWGMSATAALLVL